MTCIHSHAHTLHTHIHAVPYGNYGCSGGNVAKAFNYVISNNGIDSQSNYPYVGRVSQELKACGHAKKRQRGNKK